MPEVPAPDRPIFIIGPHRSGTTVLYRILARHGRTGYLNRVARRFPGWPWFAAKAGRVGKWDMPIEAQSVWDRWRPREDDVRLAEHATPDVVRWYRRLAAGTLRHRGATRFIAKYPRLSFRIAWIERVFEGALYVHLDRDWRAVVSSTVVRHRKRVGRDVDWFGVYPPDWEKLRGLPVEEIATRQYIATVMEIADRAPELGRRYIQVSYQQLCAAPIETMQGLLERLDLPWRAHIGKIVQSFGLENRNQKWPAELGEETVARLRAIAPDVLALHEDDRTVSVARSS